MNRNWLASWSAAPSDALRPGGEFTAVYGQTLREIARVSLGGAGVVLRFSNEFGKLPVSLDSVTIALAGEGGKVEPLTTLPVTFNGHHAAKILPGAPLVSDPIALTVAPLARLSVSYYSKGFLPLHTVHGNARQLAYVSEPGDYTEAEGMIVQQTTESHHLLSSIYVKCGASARAIVCFGDSITDGDCSTMNADRRWPDILAERLQQTPGFEGCSVLNQGIGGNRMLFGGAGDKAMQRFDRDVLCFQGASHVIILLGTNDIGFFNTSLAGPDEAVHASELIFGLSQLVARGRLAGMKVVLGTIPPFEHALPGTPLKTYFTSEKDRMRRAVNAWIRTSGCCDGVADFDAALRDEAHPNRLAARFDSGDHLHPSDAGYRALANCIDLSLLDN